MKRFVLAAIAASMLATPAAYAESRSARPDHQQTQKYRAPAPERSREHFRKPQSKHPQAHWSKGKRVPDWQRKQTVRDYHRHGLRKPARGQQWIKVGNDYLLISIASGIITSLAFSR